MGRLNFSHGTHSGHEKKASKNPVETPNRKDSAAHGRAISDHQFLLCMCNPFTNEGKNLPMKTVLPYMHGFTKASNSI